MIAGLTHKLYAPFGARRNAQSVEFPLSSDYIEAKQLLKLVGLCDSGGGKQLIADSAAKVDGHARSQGLIIVTNNMTEFLRVPGLRVENWVA